MTTTKKDLPAIRSLKAIARRKMNQHYWQIKEPAGYLENLEKRTQAYNEALDKAFKKQSKKMPLMAMRELVYQSLHYRASTHYGEFWTDALRSAYDAALAETQKFSVPKESYAHQQIAKAKKLFEELEAAELQIIAGESVDLAMFSRQLQEL